MPETIHVIITDYEDFGWSVTSPQLPELVGGRETLIDLQRDLREILAFGGAPETFDAKIHSQRVWVAPNGTEVLLRAAQDPHSSERDLVLRRVQAGAHEEPGLIQQPATPTGEVVLVACMPTDRVGWVADQIGLDKVVVIVVAVDDNLIFVSPLGLAGTTTLPADSMTLLDAGLDFDATVRDMMAIIPSNRSLVVV